MSNQEEEEPPQAPTTAIIQQPIETQPNQEKKVAKHKEIDKDQCRRNGKRWQCSKKALPGRSYCEKHQVEQNVHNEKRRKFPKKPNRFLEDPVFASGEHQCRRNGKGWRCSDMAPPGERYCHKHELEQMRYNEKRRQEGGRKRKHIVEYDEMKSGSDDSRVSKKIREGGKKKRSCDEREVSDEFRLEDVSLYPEMSAFPRIEGTENDDVNNTLTIEEIDGMQLLNANSDEHQTPIPPPLEMFDPSTAEGYKANDQPLLNDVITFHELLNEVENPACTESRDPEEAIVPAYSTTQHEIEATPLDNESSTINKSSTMFEKLKSSELIPQHSDSHLLEKEMESRVEEKALPCVEIATKTSSSPSQLDNGDMHLEDEYCPTIGRSQMSKDIDTSGLITQDSNTHPVGDEVKEICEWINTKVSTDVDVRSQLEELLKMKDEYNLPDERSKTAAKEFVDEKDQFNKILARLNSRLEPLLAELEMKGLKVVELERILDEIKEKDQPA